MDSVDLTVIIPAHNAEEGIGTLLDVILGITELAVRVADGLHRSDDIFASNHPEYILDVVGGPTID